MSRCECWPETPATVAPVLTRSPDVCVCGGGGGEGVCVCVGGRGVERSTKADDVIEYCRLHNYSSSSLINNYLFAIDQIRN